MDLDSSKRVFLLTPATAETTVAPRLPLTTIAPTALLLPLHSTVAASLSYVVPFGAVVVVASADVVSSHRTAPLTGLSLVNVHCLVVVDYAPLVLPVVEFPAPLLLSVVVLHAPLLLFVVLRGVVVLRLFVEAFPSSSSIPLLESQVALLFVSSILHDPVVPHTLNPILVVAALSRRRRSSSMSSSNCSIDEDTVCIGPSRRARSCTR